MRDVPPTDGRRRRGDASRDRALAYAVGIAQVEGLEGLSFGRVAKDASASKSTIQALFGDREALQLQTLASSIEAFQRGVVDAMKHGDVPPERPLLRLCTAWFDVVEQGGPRGGCLLTAVWSEYRGKEGPISSAVQAGRSLWTETLHRAATAGIVAAELAPTTDIEQLLFELQAFQAAANVSAAMEDRHGLARARAAARARLERDAPSGQRWE